MVMIQSVLSILTMCYFFNDGDTLPTYQFLLLMPKDQGLPSPAVSLVTRSISINIIIKPTTLSNTIGILVLLKVPLLLFFFLPLPPLQFIEIPRSTHLLKLSLPQVDLRVS